MTDSAAPIVVQSRADGAACDVMFKPMAVDQARILGAAFAAIEPWSRYPYAPAALTNYLADSEPGAPRYAIFVDGVLAGAFGVRDRWLRGPYLQFLGILPDHQRDGLGRLTLTWFETRARAHGDRNIWVAASDFNTAALAFYRTAGFQPVAQLDGLIGAGITEILLRKQICGN